MKNLAVKLSMQHALSTGASLAHRLQEISADVVQMFTSKLRCLWLIISVEQSATVAMGAQI